jgi:hypothetical protein
VILQVAIYLKWFEQQASSLNTMKSTIFGNSICIVAISNKHQTTSMALPKYNQNILALCYYAAVTNLFSAYFAITCFVFAILIFNKFDIFSKQKHKIS